MQRFFHLDRESTLLELNSERLERGLYDVRHVGLLEVVGLSSRLDPGEVQNVVDKLRRAAALRLDILAVLTYLLFIQHAPRFEKLAEDANRSQRCAQLVRDIRDEIRLHPREFDTARCGAQSEGKTCQECDGHQEIERQIQLEVPVRPLFGR